MSVVAALPTISEELTPIAPPRTKRKGSVSKKHLVGTLVCIGNNDTTQQPQNSRPPGSNNCHLPMHPSMCNSDSSDVLTTNKEELLGVSVNHLRRDQWVKSGSNTLPRIENYYTRSGPEMRRKTSEPSPANVVSLYPLAQKNSRPATESKNATPSPTHADLRPRAKESPGKSGPPAVRPYAGPGIGSVAKGTLSTRPSRPPRLPAAYNNSNKSAQHYGTTNATIVVIDSKAMGAGGERSLSAAPRNYGKMSGSRVSSQISNRDNSANVYGKKTQAALNKLAATLKRFQGVSGSGLKTKTSPVGKSKTPPKRPPPAVRNLPHPPLQTNTVPTGSSDSCDEIAPYASCTFDRNEEDSPAVKWYDDHIYMEVGFKSNVKCSSGKDGGGGDGRIAGKEGDDEDDTYVIMNPSGESSHVYTPLSYQTRSMSTGGELYIIHPMPVYWKTTRSPLKLMLTCCTRRVSVTASVQIFYSSVSVG